MIAVIFKQCIIIILFLCMEKHVAMLLCCYASMLYAFTCTNSA